MVQYYTIAILNSSEWLPSPSSVYQYIELVVSIPKNLWLIPKNLGFTMVLPWFSFMALWYKTSDGNCPTTTPPRSPGLVGLLQPCDGMVKNNWEIRMQLTINQGNILYIFIYIYCIIFLFYVHDI